jgi:hypothetical protein
MKSTAVLTPPLAVTFLPLRVAPGVEHDDRTEVVVSETANTPADMMKAIARRSRRRYPSKSAYTWSVK